MRHLTLIGCSIGAGLMLFGAWVVFGQQSYEGCLKDAAKAANGVTAAYVDLRELCDDKQAASLQISFDDLIPRK